VTNQPTVNELLEEDQITVVNGVTVILSYSSPEPKPVLHLACKPAIVTTLYWFLDLFTSAERLTTSIACSQPKYKLLVNLVFCVPDTLY
jgi:hypothetical protein